MLNFYYTRLKTRPSKDSKFQQLLCARSVSRPTYRGQYLLLTIPLAIPFLFLVCNDVNQKLKLTTFPRKLLHNVNNRNLKYLCKFQIDVPINAKMIAIQSLEDLYKGPVKLIKWAKIAHSFLQSVPNQFHVIILSLPM